MCFEISSFHHGFAMGDAFLFRILFSAALLMTCLKLVATLSRLESEVVR